MSNLEIIIKIFGGSLLISSSAILFLSIVIAAHLFLSRVETMKKEEIGKHRFKIFIWTVCSAASYTLFYLGTRILI